LLFFLRVLAQALVAFLSLSFLPAMEAWYSGLIPYHVLLPIQLVMLSLMIKICIDCSRGKGFFAIPSKRWGGFLIAFSAIYFSSMVLRYILTMIFGPEQRWFGGTIPIFFHFVLAGFIFTFGRFHTETDAT
jgi:uncharacterized protein